VRANCGTSRTNVGEIVDSFIPTFLTPRNPQKNYAGQHFWPNYLHGFVDVEAHWTKNGCVVAPYSADHFIGRWAYL
jgi:hypothetical protein